ncbi:MAG: sugar phosphate isomerase/epimerase [Pseudomonadota bacterium]
MIVASYQLYSSRAFPPLASCLSLLKRLGYTQVEGYPDLLSDVPALKHVLTEAGLSMPSSHVSLGALESSLDEVVARAQAIGITHLYAPYLELAERPASAEAWRQFGQRLERIAQDLAVRGLVFGWHNHDFEFTSLADGSIPMAIVLDSAPTVRWQADLAWVARAGQEPAAWLRRYGDRVASVHVKDIAPDGQCLDEDGWADVGHGVLAWHSLLAIARACAVDHFVVEHDNPSDHARFAQRSIDSIRAFSEGD